MEQGYANRRRYVRHAIRVPMRVRPKNGTPEFASRAGDLSEGGVSFVSPSTLEVGRTVDVEVPVHHSRFTLSGTVASCTAMSGGTWRVGLAFVEPGPHFKMKLVEQVLRIADLQETLSRERGVEVSSREAAEIWVERYADSFADLY